MSDGFRTRVLAPDELRALLGEPSVDPLDDLPTRRFERPVRTPAARPPAQDSGTYPATAPLVRPPAPSRSARRPETALQICLEPVPEPPPARAQAPGAGRGRRSDRVARDPGAAGVAKNRVRAPSLDPAPPTRTRSSSPGRTGSAGARRLIKWGLVGFSALGLGAAATLWSWQGLSGRASAGTPTRDGAGSVASAVRGSPVSSPETATPASRRPPHAGPVPGVAEREVEREKEAPAARSDPRSARPSSSDDPTAQEDAEPRASAARVAGHEGHSEQLRERLDAAVSALSRGELTRARDLYRALAQDTGRPVFAELSDALERQRACSANESEVSCD